MSNARLFTFKLTPLAKQEKYGR